MTGKIKRTHFARYRHGFNENGIIKTNSLRELTPTPQRIVERVSRIPWNWINKKIYDPDILQNRIVEQRMRLFDLLDHSKDGVKDGGKDSDENVGYVIAVDPDIDIRRSFLNAMACTNPVEIENIALFPTQAGRGRGRSFLNLIEARLFSDGHDLTYLNTSETNFPTLPGFYTRAGMICLGQDEVVDFNDRQRSPVDWPKVEGPQVECRQIVKFPDRHARPQPQKGALISRLP